jgi:hypothetical protein
MALLAELAVFPCMVPLSLSEEDEDALLSPAA